MNPPLIPLRIWPLLALGLLILGQKMSAQSVTQDSVVYYTQQLEGHHPPLKRAHLQNQLAWFLSSRGDSKQATVLTLAAIEVFNGYHDYKGLQQAYTNLAQIFQFEHRTDKALEYGKKALDNAVLSRDSSLICLTMQGYAMALGESRQFKASLSYFNQSLHLASARRDTNNLLRIYLNASSILVDKGDNEQTIEYAQQGLQLAVRRNQSEDVLRAAAIVGAALTQLNRFEGADRYFNQAEARLPAIGSLFYDRELAMIRIRWAEKQGNYQQAFHYQKTYFSLDTALANQANRQQVAELEVRYRTKETEQIKAHLEQELIYQRWLFVGGGLLLLLIIIVIYLQRKRLRHQNQLLEARQEMTCLQLQTATEQLTLFANVAVERNAFIDQIKQELEEVKTAGVQGDTDLIEQLNRARMLTDEQWDDFRIKFEQLHPQFIDRLRRQVSNLTDTELKMACMIRLHFSASQMAGMLGISAEGIKKNRYRLRKKMNIDDLSSYISAV